MRFGPVPLAEAEGAVLAHSLAAGGLRLKKGRLLGAAELAALAAAGIAEVTVARLEPGDMPEDAAAEAVARALAPDPAALGLAVAAPFTGRVNFFAEAAGLVRVDRAAVDALNRVDPGLTLATLPDWARVQARAMVATVKVIPYGVAAAAVERAAAVAAGALRVAAFRPGSASLILTRTPGLKPSLLAKGAEAVAARLAALGLELIPPVTVAARDRAGGGGGAPGDRRHGADPRRLGDLRRRRHRARAGLSRRAGGSCASACRSIRATCSFSASMAAGRWSGCPAAPGRRR